MRQKWTRRALAHGLGALGGGALLALTEPYRPVLTETLVVLPELPPAFDGVRVLHLSDLHVQKAFPLEALAPALKLAESARADLLVLTGDYCWDREPSNARTLAQCAAALESLARSCPLGAFCVFGNHDFPLPPADPERGPWESAGIRPLLDQAVEVRRGNDSLQVVGLRSALVRPVSPMSVLAQAPAEAFKLALWHEPDRAAEVAQAGASLLLCGHTHGGQLVLPGIGPLRLPALGQKFPGGLHRLGNMPLFVTRGLGVLPPRLRFCCPPEVSVLVLRRSPASGGT
jgi:uncharacterized protein